MNYRFIYIFIVLLLGVINDSFGQLFEKPFTVVIDPGHGGKDPGTMNKNVMEKDIVLRIGLQLGAYIKEKMPDVNVIFTRETDIFIPLYERANIANRNKADLFISIHVNHFSSEHIFGTETYVLGFHNSEANLKVAKKENAVILLEDDHSTRYEGFDPNSPESYIMFEMAQDEFRLQSIELGLMVQNRFQEAGRKNRGVLQAGLLVLRESSMPGVLIEAGYLSNPEEAKYLTTDTGEKALAFAIFTAIQAYKISLENKRARLLHPNIKDRLVQKPQIYVNSEGMIKLMQEQSLATDNLLANNQPVKLIVSSENTINQPVRTSTVSRRKQAVSLKDIRKNQNEQPDRQREDLQIADIKPIQSSLSREDTIQIINQNQTQQSIAVNGPGGNQSVNSLTYSKKNVVTITKESGQRQQANQDHNKRVKSQQKNKKTAVEKRRSKKQNDAQIYNLQQSQTQPVVLNREQFPVNQRPDVQIYQHNQPQIDQQQNYQTQQAQTQRTYNIESGTYYSVQISANRTRLSFHSDRFKDLHSLFETREDGWYKYLCYKENSYKIIEMLRIELLSKFPDAFIVAYKNGVRIPITEDIILLNP